jgi:hypothetical protein
MGHDEIATFAVGLRIGLQELLSQINRKNWPVIRVWLRDGFLEEPNGEINIEFRCVVEEMPESPIWRVKRYWQHQLNENRFPVEGSTKLSEHILLVPLAQIIQTERYGHNREGLNGVSRPFDLESLARAEESSWLAGQSVQGATVVMIAQQYAW